MTIPSDFYEQTAGHYDAPINQIFYQNIAKELLGVIDSARPPRTILEVGAGVGFSTSLIREAYPDADLNAVEPAPSMARRGSRRAPEANWEHLPVARMKSRRFDLIFSSMSYHWLDPGERTQLSAMAQGGCLAIALSVTDKPRAALEAGNNGNESLRRLVSKMRPDLFWSRRDRRTGPLMEDLSRTFGRVTKTYISMAEPFPNGRVFADTMYARGTLLALFSSRAEEAREELAAIVWPEPISFHWRVALVTARSAD